MRKEKFKRKIRQAAAAIAALAMAVSFTFPAGTEIMGVRLGNAIVASAEESGTCGANLTWTLDDNGTLTISGSGAMYDFGSRAPWYNYQDRIRSVDIVSGVTSIGEAAFYDCSSLTSITIPDSVTSIGAYAFNGCTSLTSIAIPYSVTSIEHSAFSSCTSLTSISVDENNPNYCSYDGVLFNKGKTTLVAYPDGKGASYVIPNGVSSIGAYAFHDCSSLTSITIPDGVTSIGDFAFYFCTSLTSVTFPDNDSLTSIGAAAFAACSSLTSITIPDSVTSIGQQAFFHCTSLTSIFLPEAAAIGANAIPDSATQIKYTVTDDKVTITEITGQTSVDIPEKISGYPVVYVEETYRQYVGTHTCAGGTATCTEKAVCGICGQDISALGHDYSGKWLANNNEHWKVCARNGCSEVIDKGVHTSDGGVVTTQPTATAPGVITYSCTVCGIELKKEYIPATEEPSKPSAPVYSPSTPPSITITPVHFTEKLEAEAELMDKSTVKLTWDKIESANKYTVYQLLNGKYIRLLTTSDTTAVIKKLNYGETYQFLVKYSTNGVTSPISYSDKITVKVEFKPIVKATADENSVRLSWKKVPGAEKYAVYKYVNGKAVKLTETEKLAVKINKLQPDTEYKYIVRAYVDGKWTSMTKSDIVTVKTKAE